MVNFEINLNEASDSLLDGWMSWSARGTQDGSVEAKNFFIKTSDGEKVVCKAIKEKGVVFDLVNMSTGWQQFSDNGSDWVWNEDLKSWQTKPGDDYKKGLSIPIAIDDKKMVIWRQSGVACMAGLESLISKVNGKATDKLPVVKLIDTKVIKFKSGTSTVVPVLDVVDWVERPFVLEAEQDKNAPDVSEDSKAVSEDLKAVSEF